jgi:hypothetical protein
MNEFMTKFMESPEFFYETIGIVVLFIFAFTIIRRR